MLFYLITGSVRIPRTARFRRGVVAAGNQLRFHFRGWARTGANARQMPKGLNENYGRELMELHTLGVDGGYTQKDVTEVARALTGGRFELHDLAEILCSNRGYTIRVRRLFSVISSKQAAARRMASRCSTSSQGIQQPHISSRRSWSGGFVNDVHRLRYSIVWLPGSTKTMETCGGDADALDLAGVSLKQCLPCQHQDALRVRRERPSRNKRRRAGWGSARRAVQELACRSTCVSADRLQRHRRCVVNTGALVNRINFALRLTSNELRDISVADLTPIKTSSLNLIVNGDVSETTRSTIASSTTASQMAAADARSPEFQRR